MYAEYESYKKRIHESNRLHGNARPISNQQSYYDDIDGLNDLTLHPVHSNAQSQTREAASVVSLESLTYHAKSIFSCNNSADDFRENGGPSASDKMRDRFVVDKGVSHHLSSLESSGIGSPPQIRTFGSSRNR